MIKSVIFDFDGVLVESLDVKTRTFANLFKKEGEEISKAVVDYHLSNTGVSRYDKFRYIYSEILRQKLTDDKFNKLCEEFSDMVMADVIRAPAVKGALEFLTSYNGFYRFFIASATPQEEIERIAAARNMAVYFKRIYGAPMRKSDMVKEVLNSENLQRHEVVYVGDAMSDYRAASTNGVHFIARVIPNTTIFDYIDCLKVEDLTGLGEIVRKL